MNSGVEPEFIDPPKNLKAKVDFNEEGIDLSALEMVEENINELIDNDLADEYIEATIIVLEKLQSLYSSAQKKPDAMQATFKEMYSVAHDMKGQGGSFGYDLVTDICDSFCHTLESIEEPGLEHLVLVKLHIDSVRFVIARKMKGDGGEDGKKMVEGIRAVVAKVLKKS